MYFYSVAVAGRMYIFLRALALPGSRMYASYVCRCACGAFYIRFLYSGTPGAGVFIIPCRVSTIVIVTLTTLT